MPTCRECFYNIQKLEKEERVPDVYEISNNAFPNANIRKLFVKEDK